MNSLETLACAGLVAVCAAPAVSANRLEETVVVSSRVAMPLRQVGTSVSIVSAEDLELRGFANLANALRYEPSVSVINNGGAGKATSLRVRGELGFRTKLLLDGMELTDTSAPQAFPHFAHLVNSGFERVEILRGSQGVMYGADAGGVINLVTQSPTAGLGGSISAEYGRYNSSNLTGSLSGGNDRGDFALMASRQETDGFNSRATDTVLQDDDGYENDTVYARGGLNLGDGFRLGLQARSVDGDNEFDTCSDVNTFEPTDRCSDKHEEDGWRASLSHRSDTLEGELSYQQFQTDREFFSVGQSSFATEGELKKLSYLGSWRVDDGLQLVYGVDLMNEGIDDGTLDTDRDQDGYFFEYQGGFGDRLFVTAGARYDDNDDFGSETTYRISGAYLIPAGDGEIKLKSTYGTGFRAPSLSEIAYNTGEFAFPPALGFELSAEKSAGFDIGAGYYADSGWFAEAVLYSQTVEDEIFFDLVDFSGYLQGDGDSESKGIELIGEAPLTEVLGISGNYTYNDAENADGVRRPRAPQHLANLGIHLHALDDRLKASLNLRVSRDAPEEENGEIDDYEVLDLSVSYAVLDNLEVFGRVENLTDEDYQELPTFNTSGAAGYAGVRYRFQ